MEKLLEQNCIPCSGYSQPLTEKKIAELKPQVPQWNIIYEDGKPRLQRFYEFPDFKNALDFTQRVGEEAEKEGHHPSLLCEWGKVTVTWWTHAIKGLHGNDFIMAAKTDSLYSDLTPFPKASVEGNYEL